MTEQSGDARPGRLRRRRRRRLAAITLGAFLIVVAVLIVLAPAIAATLLPGLIRDAARDRITGNVAVSRASLSWFGRQVIGPVTVEDDKGVPVARLTVEVSRGLFGLLTGPLDLGRVTVTGEATVVRSKEGETNIERLIRPRPAGSANAEGPARLPKGLASDVKLDGLRIRFVDESSARQIELRGVTGSATIAGGNAALAVDAPAFAVEPGAPDRPVGSLKIDARVTNLADGSGLITPAAATIDATIDAKDLSTEIAGVLTGLGERLVKGVGETLEVSVKVKGSTSEGDATVVVKSRGVNADLGLRASSGVITNSRPGSVTVSGAALWAMSPRVEQVLTDAGVKIDAFPDATVTVDSLRVPVPSGGASLDLRTANAVLEVRTTGARGVLALPDHPARPFELSPVVARIDAQDLAAGVKVTMQTGLTLDGAPAGTVGVDLLAAGLLGPNGKPAAALPSVSGRVALSNVSTTAIQPLVEKAGIDLPSGVGPTLDVTIASTPGSGGGGSGGSSNTTFDVQVKSKGLGGSGTVVASGSTVEGRGEFSLASPEALIGKALARQGVRMSSGGAAKVMVRSLAMAADGASPLDALTADAGVSFGGFSVGPVDAPGDAVAVNQFDIGVRLARGQDAAIDVKGTGSHSGGEFQAEGAASLPGLFAKGSAGTLEFTPARTRPTGSLTISNIPVSLVALAAGKPGEVDVPGLVRQAIGPAVTVTVNATARQGRPEARDLVLQVNAERLKGEINAGLDESAISVSRMDFRTTMSPELAVKLLDMAGAAVESRPALTGPAAIIAIASPVTIPIRDSRPRLDQAGDLAFTIGLEGKTSITNLSYTDQDGVKRDVGIVGLQDILLKGTVPLSALSADSGPRPATVALTGLILDEKDTPIAEVKGSAKSGLSGRGPVGDLAASLALSIRDSTRLDAVLNRPGFLSGAIGPEFELNSSAAMTFAGPDSAEALERARFDLSMTSERIATTQALKGTASKGVLTIESPMVLTWRVDDAWANSYLLAPAKEPRDSAKTGSRLAGPVVLTIALSKLTIPAGDAPFKPGVFFADALVTVPEVSLIAGETRSAIKSLSLRVMGGHEPGVIGFSLRAEDLGSGPGANGTSALQLQGGLYNLADAAGTPTPDAAALTMTGDAYGASSALLDALANQGGLLAETLGPIVTVHVRTEGANRARGQVVLNMESPRAEAEVKGVIAGGTFIAEGEPKITFNTMTPELGHMLVKGLPLIGTFEKKVEDGPAVVTVKGLVAPLDGGIQKLQGEFIINLGVARFEASKVFGALLRLTSQRESGTVGRRLEPLTLTFKDGVMTYHRWKIPLGEFTVDTRGTVDFVNRNMDVITYIPFGALTDEAAGKLNTGLGRLIGGAVPLIEQATMVPFRTRGSFDDPKTEADMELFVKEAGQTLLRPDRIIRDGLRNIFKGPEKQPDKPKPDK